MRILLLLTLSGLAVGLGVDRNCDGRVNGVYATSPCSNKFNHCYNGQVTIKTCPRGLVFNPDSNQCDFDSNVSGCAARAEVTCSNREDGAYTIGCSSSFFFCSNGIIHMSTCQNGLFYDVDRKTCDHKFRVRACGGHPEVEREPVTRPPLVVPTYAPTALKSYAKIGGYAHVTPDLSHSCKGKTDGAHSLGSCSQQYVLCTDEVSQLAECAPGEVFGDSGDCVLVTEASGCSAAMSGISTFDCSSRQDGYYGMSCSSEFVYCNGGVAQPMKCPSLLVFNQALGYCDYPEDCSSAHGLQAQSQQSALSQRQPSIEQTKSVSLSFCAMRKDGFYAEKCSADFVSCKQGKATPMRCPSGLLFNDKKGYCDYPEDCASDHSPSAQGAPATSPPFDCKGKKDGYYSEGCVREFVYCLDGVASRMNCPPSLVFNEKEGYCDYAESCSAGSAAAAAAPTAPPLSSFASDDVVPIPSLCKGKKDGYYSNGCSAEFVYCLDGVAAPMTCPSSLVFNAEKGYCDYPERCSAASTHAVPVPSVSASHIVVTTQSRSSTAYSSSTQSSSIDCKGRKNGYYSNGCVADFVYCIDGVASPMTCPTSLVFNEKKGYCDYVENCSAGTGPAVPVAALADIAKSAVRMESSVASTYASLTSSSNIDCKGRKDGYYSNGCVPDFVYCIDGVASTMKCPTSLVFNERKGYCDYAENCAEGPAPARPAPTSVLPVAPSVRAQSSPAHAYVPPAPSSSIECKGRKDGYYSNGCVADFVYCVNEVASPMTCPTSLVFNERKGYCDYPESCITGAAPAVPVPVSDAATSVQTAIRSQSSVVSSYAQHTRSSSIDCKGRKDGYYSDGCLADFVYCIDGKASPMTCPASLVFNEKKGYCDYAENCSLGPAPAVAAATPAVVAPAQTVVWTQSSVTSARAPPTSSSTIDCKGRKDGYYSDGCVAEFVSCVDGVASPMTCPASLVFNEKKGYCDYLESCITRTAPAVPVPVPAAATPAQTVTRLQSSVVSSYAQHTSSSSIDCKGRKDGYYSDGCVADFVYCIDGKASPMTCPASLVFNEKKGYCDYLESCITGPAPAVPVPVPAAATPAQTVTRLQSSVVSSYAQHTSSSLIDCKGRKDGYYSDGCVAEFVSCVDGVASPMTCPTSLVFNEKKGYCDYVENCSAGTAPAVPVAAPADVAQPAVRTQSSAASAYASLTSSSNIDCKGRKDGYYSNGCVPDFVYCIDGVASPMKCPASLVFNERKGYCDYAENCAVGPAATHPAPTSVLPVPAPSVKAQSSPAPAYAPPVPSSSIDCKGRKDGYYSNGCVAEFVSCVDGVASPMTCPALLVFNEKKGYCDYPESCIAGPAPAVTVPVSATATSAETVTRLQSSVVSSYAQHTRSSLIDCKGRKDGYYSDGCVADFVSCVDGVASPMTCPISLVFNEKKGYCDYPESCIAGPAPAVPIPVPAAATPAQTVTRSHTSVVSSYAQHTSSSSIDCKGREDGYYSDGCVADFVYCTDGVASPMTCPASLVFNEKKGYCDYAENCAVGSAPARPAPIPVLPVLAPSVKAHSPPAPANAPLAPSSSVDCKGRKDGYYSDGCVAEFVYCSDGVASPMTCPASLVFNENTGYCDYPENCSVRPALAAPAPAVAASAPAVAASAQTVVRAQSSVVSAYAPPTSSSSIDCKGRNDGYYSDGCVAEFVYCVDGVASPMTCPASLVFNENTGYCDYPENCSTGPATAIPVPTVVPPARTASRTQSSVASAYAPPAPSSNIDCKGRKDGYYSNGCVADFVYCVDGVASSMRCPAFLVFNEKKGYCDYAENCSMGRAPAVPVGTAAVVAPAQTVVKTQSSVVSAFSPPSRSQSIECKGRKDGYYSMGCSSDFVYCVDGVSTLMSCPSSLVFNEKTSYCDYPESCSSVTARSGPVVAAHSSASSFSYSHSSSTSGTFDCTGRDNGYFANGCSSDFVYCNEGIATFMKCPAFLVFNVEKSYCDYPENCSGKAVSQADTGKVAVAPAIPGYRFVCPKPNGAFSNGCSSEFYICSNGAAQVMLCPGDLVFNAAEGYCDLKENCQGGGQAKAVAEQTAYESIASTIAPVLTSSAAAVVPVTSASTECSSLPDGRYGSPCGRKFMICSSGIAYFMNCPGDLVFDSMKNRCVHSHECGLEPILKSSADAAPTSYTSLASRSECVGKSDGLHSLGCIAEFIQCVDGETYSLYCPAGLVFVEELSICDVPSACSQAPKHEPVSGAMSYEPVTDKKAKDVPECDTDGYFSQPCASAYYNCVGGRKFVGKCPAGLVFNMDKVYCDYPENCRQGEDAASTEARPVPSTVVNKDDSCKGRPDGVITDTDCQPKFTTCLSDVAFVTKCPAGLLYSLTAKMCDYPEACGKPSADSVTSPVENRHSASSSSVKKTIASSETRVKTVSVQYQHSVIGKDLCADKSDGPLNSTDCRPSFSFCVNGALYSTNCPEGLLYSFASRRCEPASECGKVVSRSESSSYSTVVPLRPAGDSTKEQAIPSPVPPSTHYVPVQPPSSVAQSASGSVRVSVTYDFDCSTRANGKYSLGGCVGRFVLCTDGLAYVRSCPDGLVFNEAKGFCDYDCSSVTVGSASSDVSKSIHVQSQSNVTHIRQSIPARVAPVEAECVASVALTRCSSKFLRCRNGKLESAQCPGQSLYDETLSLCVYDLPQCKTETSTAKTDEVTSTVSAPIVSTDTVYKSAHSSGGYSVPAAPSQQYPARNAPYGSSMYNPFAMLYPQILPMGIRDAMHGREKVNHGPINFQPRSMLAGGFRPPVRDIFDGIVSPWLYPGIDRVFVPNMHKRHRPRGPDDEYHGPRGIDISPLLEQADEVVSESPGVFEAISDGMRLESAVPHEDDEEHKDLHGVELESVPIENVPSDSPMDTPVSTDAAEVEGSGEDEVTRKRRSIYVSESKDVSSTCTSSQSPGLISLGSCQQDFIFCKAVDNGVLAACPVGDLFDSSTNKCVISESCGKPQQVVLLPAQEPVPVVMPAPAPAPPSIPVAVPSVPIPRPAQAVPLTTTTKRPPVIFPPVPAPVSVAHQAPVSQPRPAPTPVALPAADRQLKQFDCAHGSDYAVDCNGNFIKCVHGIAYPMKCPAGLVYDQTKQYCDYPASVAGCAAVQMDQTRPDHSLDDDKTSVDQAMDKTYPGAPIVIPTTQAPKLNAPDFCAYLSDGPHTEGCTASFVVCHNRQIQTSMNCPVGTWFDQTRGICDFREKVAACGGALEPASNHPEPVVVWSTTQSSTDASCSPHPKPAGRCMSKFVICSNGIQSEFDCAKPLVFNPATVSCDFREFVSECEEFKGSQDTAAMSYDAASPSMAPSGTTAAPTTTTVPPSCVYSEERPAFALDYCARVYGMCSEHGVLKREECSVGFLFDSHLNTCVPSEQCGQERLKDLISKVNHATPVEGAQVATHKETSKYAKRKDDRCRNSLEGAMKPLGRCRSSYIRCAGGEAIIEPCATTAEVFSSAVGACVLRVNAPECHTAPQRSPPPFTSASSSDPSAFCRTRTDGLYRNPTDCAGILQCFGGDVFEYPSCSSGLVFNELTAKCDYRHAVPECHTAADDSNVERGCRGAKHGDFVADETDCQQFYRCVWDRLEPMRCPSGTVFNPKLSVCDWPDNVPQCSVQQDELTTKSY